MKKLLTLTAIAGLALSVVAISQPKKQNATIYKVDAKESTFKWTGKKVTGDHTGNITFNDGTVTTDGKNVTGGTFTIDMTSIVVTDLTGEYKDKLEGHLKSDDFFSTDKFKTSTIEIKAITPIAGAKPGEVTHNIKADLTIKGITNEVAFPAQIIVTKDKIIANAEFPVDRTLYGIKYTGMADNLIENNFTAKVRVIAKP